MDNRQLVEWMASPLSKFKPWTTADGRSPQRDYIQAAGTHKVRIIRAGNRIGKSEVNAWDHVSIAQGFHPYFPKRPPVRGWIIGTDWAQGIGTVIWPKIKRYLIPGTYQVSFMRRSAPEIPSAIVFANGSEIHFKSAESGPSKFAGADLDFVWIDEEIERSVVEEARARLIDRGGLLSVSLTPVARMQWVCDLEAERDSIGRPRTKVVRASMRDAMEAGILNREAVEAFLANLPERQRKVRELGDYASMEGMVYPDFRRDVHCLTPKNGGLYDATGKWVYSWPLPKTWRRYAAMDFGYVVPSAVVIVCEDPFTDHLIVERVLYASGIRMSKWGYDLVHPSGLRLLPTLEAPLIVDHDAMERAELAACGVSMIKAEKHKKITPGLEAVERALMPMADGRPKLQFVLAKDSNPPRNPLTGRDDCYHLIWEIERYRYKPRDETKPDVKDEPVKKDDHAMDALRYLIYFLERKHYGDAPSMPDGDPKPNPFDGLMPPNPWR